MPASHRKRAAATPARRAPRKRPQQSRSQATVEAILEAAADVFCADGFAGGSTNAIARRAGVSIGSLYQYFPNKLALLEALRERHIKGLWEELAKACDDGCALPWPGALRSMIARCSAYNGRRVALLAILHQELPLQAWKADSLTLAEATFHADFRRFLEAHRRSLKVSVDQALFMLPTLGRGIFTAAAVEQPHAMGDGSLVDQVVAVMLGYLT